MKGLCLRDSYYIGSSGKLNDIFIIKLGVKAQERLDVQEAMKN